MSGPRHRVCVDVMGSDHHPKVIIDAVRAVAQSKKCQFLLFGTAEAEKAMMAGDAGIGIDFVATETSVPTGASVRSLMSSYKTSSMWRGLSAVKNGEAGIFVTAAHTGALCMFAVRCLGRIKGVSKPALCCTVKSPSKPYMLDVGLNVTADAKELVMYAVMGCVFRRCLKNNDAPLRICQLSIAEEENRVPYEVARAHHILSNINGDLFEYGGICSPQVIADALYDVMLTDGLTGNIAIKSMEGVFDVIMQMMGVRDHPGKAQDGSIRGLFTDGFWGGLLCKVFSGFVRLVGMERRLSKVRTPFASILGLNGLVIKVHGNCGFEPWMSVLSQSVEWSDISFIDEMSSAVQKYAKLMEEVPAYHGK